MPYRKLVSWTRSRERIQVAGASGVITSLRTPPFPLCPGLASGTAQYQAACSICFLSSGLTPSLGFVYFYQGSPLIPFSKNVRNSLLSLGAGSNPSPFSFWALKYTSHMPVTFQQKPFFLIPKPWAGSCLLPLCSHTAPLLTYLILSLTGPVEVLNPPRRFPTSASPGVFPSHGLACYSLPVFLAINCVTFFNFEYVRFVC